MVKSVSVPPVSARNFTPDVSATEGTQLFPILQEYAFERHNQVLPPTGAFRRMSGRFSLSKRSRVPGAAQLAGSWTATSKVTRRLLLALGLSFLFHAVLLVLPYLGGGTGENAEVAGGSRFRYRIHATLAPERGLDAVPGSEITAQINVPQSEPAQAAGSTQAETDATNARSGGPLPIAAPAYYTTDQLSKRPQMLPEAPLDEDNLRVLAASGKVVLRLWISDRGEVVASEIERSDLPAEFSASVAAAFRRVRFAPGERAGLPVGSIIRVEINYSEERRSAP